MSTHTPVIAVYTGVKEQWSVNNLAHLRNDV